MKRMADFIKVTDPRGICVICSEGQWVQHISEGHPDIKKDVVEETVQKPEAIYPDNKHEDREVYIKSSDDYENEQTRVVVAIGGGYGNIVTAYNERKGKSPDGKAVYISNDKI